MDIKETRQFEIAKLILPGDYAVAAASPRVKEYAESIGKVGQFQPVGVEDRTNELVWGRKRVAATKLLKQAFVFASVVVFDDNLEKEEVTLRENLDREELTADERRAARVRIAEIAELRAKEKQVAAHNLGSSQLTVDKSESQDAEFPALSAGKSQPSENTRQRGRPSKGRSEAAKAAGIKERQLRKDLAKAKGANGSNGATRRAHDDGPAKPAIDTLGLDVPATFLSAAADGVAGLKAIDAYLVRAKGELTKLSNAGIVDGSRLQRIKRDLDALAQDVRNAIPVSVCMYCKRRKAKCDTCHGSGLMAAEQQESVPKELKRKGDDAGIYVDGKFVKLSELAADA